MFGRSLAAAARDHELARDERAAGGTGVGHDRGYVIPRQYWAWVGDRRTLRVAAWLFALGVGVHHFLHARAYLAEPDAPPELRRPVPGARGYTEIDFGGQWVMGRMLVLGHGPELYHRQVQWGVVRDGYPRAEESPAQRDGAVRHDGTKPFLAPFGEGHDDDNMMYWFMGADPPAWKAVGGAVAASLVAPPADPFTAAVMQHAAESAVTTEQVAEIEAPAVGGPLYPPVHAFFYAPLGLFDRPRDAYLVFQVLAVGFAYLAGLGISVLSRGRIWWSAAGAAVLLYPGCRSALELGQNPTVTLSIVVWGWVLAARGREAAGGAVWGLLAFKPVWAMAFFLVPLLMGRWRVCLAMVGTGAALGAFTLPFVGVRTWFDWLAVGKEAAALYNVNENWVHLCRDLQGIPRRYLLDFSLPEAERDTPLAQGVAWGLWGVVFAATVLVYMFRADRRDPLGRGAAFLFLGAFLTCYRFMYYDVLMSLAGVAVLLSDPRRLFRTRVFDLPATSQPVAVGREPDTPAAPADPFGPRLVGYVNSFPLTVLAALFVLENWLVAAYAEATFGLGVLAHATAAADGSTGLATPRLWFNTGLHTPCDTVLVLGLWAWCGLRLVLKRERPEASAA